MQRRQFLASSLSASAAVLAQESSAAAEAPVQREYYQLRRYQLQTGPQTRLAESYFAGALIPALKRLRMGPIGAFRLEIGPETPSFYVLVPGSDLTALATLDLSLAQDREYQDAARAFTQAPATSPAYLRFESALMAAFPGWPKLTPPASSATKAKRIFQLRTYESPSDRDHVRKVEMFHSGEFEIFANAGFHQVFYGDTLVGQRLPKLTYMLSFGDMNELNGKWDVFRQDPAWKKLSTSPQYSFEEIVSNISNLILDPLDASEI